MLVVCWAHLKVLLIVLLLLLLSDLTKRTCGSFSWFCLATGKHNFVTLMHRVALRRNRILLSSSSIFVTGVLLFSMMNFVYIFTILVLVFVIQAQEPVLAMVGH